MSRKKTNSLSTFVNTILRIYGEHPFKPMNYKQIAKIMGVRDAAGKDVIFQVLETLNRDGQLIEHHPYSYVLNPDLVSEYGPKPHYVVGTVDMKSPVRVYRPESESFGVNEPSLPGSVLPLSVSFSEDSDSTS